MLRIGVVSMKEIDYLEYMYSVQVPIEDAIEDALFDVFKWVAEYHGFEIPAEESNCYTRGIGCDKSLEQRQFDLFHSYYWDGYAGEFRDKAIELFEWLGMDVKAREMGGGEHE